jgi:poly(A) polymerase Pap1
MVLKISSLISIPTMNKGQKPGYHGITPPVSTKQPEKYEIEATEKLIEELGKHGQYESAADAQKRYSLR